MISVIVPVYNEGQRVEQMVAHLRQISGLTEVVLADASDAPASQKVIDALGKRIELDGDPFVRLVKCQVAGRAAQMNAGAAHCRGTILLFLHCDTRLPTTAAECIAERIATGHVWGWFNLRLDANNAVYRLLEYMINLRSRLCHIATGDQAIFVARHVFKQQRGFAEIVLMEDVEFSRRLKRLDRPRPITQFVVTSARRWQKNGVLRTVLSMWKLRFLYYLGRSPQHLATRYQHVR